MKTSTANLVTHTAIICLAIGSALTLGLGGEISGGEAIGFIAAAGGVGVAGALGVSVGSKGAPPPA